MEDVKNEKVDTNQEGTSPSESETKSNEGSLETSPSAGSLNTEEVNKTIPYDRFKEKVEEANKLKAEVEAMQDYKKHFETVENDDYLRENYNKMIEEYNKKLAGETTEKAEYQPNKETGEKPDPKQQKIDELLAMSQKTQQYNIQRYANKFKELASQDFDESQLPYVARLVDGFIPNDEAIKMNYDPKIIEDAYTKAKSAFESYSQKKVGNIATNKENAVPVNSGSAPKETNKTMSREDFINEYVEMKKKG
jgi:hypothetical protein